MTFAFALIGSWVLLKVVDSLIGLRVNDDEETEGLILSYMTSGVMTCK